MAAVAEPVAPRESYVVNTLFALPGAHTPRPHNVCSCMTCRRRCPSQQPGLAHRRAVPRARPHPRARYAPPPHSVSILTGSAVAQLEGLALVKAHVATDALSSTLHTVHEAHSSVLAHVEAAKTRVSKAVTDTKQSTHRAVSALSTTAQSLVHNVTHQPLSVTAVNTLLFAEEKVAGIVSLAEDLSEIALDKVLQPEVSAPRPFANCLSPSTQPEEEIAQMHAAAITAVSYTGDIQAEAAAPAVGQATSEVVHRFGKLAGKLRRRTVTKAVRNYTETRARGASAVASLTPIYAQLVEYAASVTRPSATPTEDGKTDEDSRSVTFAGFHITPVSNFAESTLAHVRAVDHRRQELLLALHTRLDALRNRAVAAIPSVPVPKPQQLAHAVHVRASAFADAHPWIEAAVSSLHLPTVCSQPHAFIAIDVRIAVAARPRPRARAIVPQLGQRLFVVLCLIISKSSSLLRRWCRRSDQRRCACGRRAGGGRCGRAAVHARHHHACRARR